MKVFLDANLLIYLHTVSDEKERRKLDEFLRELLLGELFIDMLVVDEVLYISKRKFGVPYSETLAFLEEVVLPQVEIIPIERGDYPLVKKFMLNYTLKPSDAIHLACMEKAGIDIIASEDEELDRSHVQRIWVASTAGSGVKRRK